MSDGVLIAIITVIGGGIVAIAGSLLTIFVNRWFKKMDEKIDEYHKAVNGKMDKLLEVTAAAKKAEGKLEGREELKNEQGNGNT